MGKNHGNPGGEKKSGRGYDKLTPAWPGGRGWAPSEARSPFKPNPSNEVRRIRRRYSLPPCNRKPRPGNGFGVQSGLCGRTRPIVGAFSCDTVGLVPGVAGRLREGASPAAVVTVSRVDAVSLPLGLVRLTVPGWLRRWAAALLRWCGRPQCPSLRAGAGIVSVSPSPGGGPSSLPPGGIGGHHRA